jgi:hypothetical protein
VGTLISSAPFCPRDVHRVAAVRDWGPFYICWCSLSRVSSFLYLLGVNHPSPVSRSFLSGKVQSHCQRQICVRQSQLELAITAGSLRDQAHPTTNSVCLSWIATRFGTPGWRLMFHLDHHTASAPRIHLDRARNLRTLCTSCRNLHSREDLPNSYSTAPSAPHTRVLEALLGSFHPLVAP